MAISKRIAEVYDDNGTINVGRVRGAPDPSIGAGDGPVVLVGGFLRAFPFSVFPVPPTGGQRGGPRTRQRGGLRVRHRVDSGATCASVNANRSVGASSTWSPRRPAET